MGKGITPVVKDRSMLIEVLSDGITEFLVDGKLWEGRSGNYRATVNELPHSPVDNRFVKSSYEIIRGFNPFGLEKMITDKVKNEEFLVYFRVAKFDWWDRRGITTLHKPTEGTSARYGP